MADFFFVVRTFLIAVAFFLAMQIRVGSRTVEQHSVAWVHSSPVIESLQNVSDGAVHVFHVASHKMTALFTHVPAIGAESEGTRDAKRRTGKRAEGRKAMSHETIAVAPAQKPATKPDANDQVINENEPRQGSGQTGSFRSFFDVKTVHDADSN